MFGRLVLQARGALTGALSGRDATGVEGRNYRNLLLSGAWYGPVDGGILNFLPVFLARLGASATTVSLLTSAPALIGIVGYIPGGAYTERQRDLVRLTVRAALVARLAFLGIAFMPLFLPEEYWALAAVLLWCWTAIPSVVHLPAWTGVMQAAVTPGKRARLNGTRWALAALTAAISIAAFGRMLDRMPFPSGYQLVFLVSFIAGILNMFYFGRVQIPHFIADDRPSTAGAPIGERLRGFLEPLAESRPFVRYNVANVGYRLALAMPVGLFSIFWVQDLQASDALIGVRGTVGYVGLVAGYFLWGRVANRIGHRALLLLVGAGVALYTTLTAMVPSAIWLVPVALLWGFSFGGLDIGLFDTLLLVCPQGRVPTFAAAAQVLTSIAVVLGPLLGAALSQVVGVRTALLAIGVIQLAATGFFLLLPSREQEGLA